MRSWAPALGVVGGGLSAAFWTLVPFSGSTSNIYMHSGMQPLYIAFVVLSLAGLIGGLVAGQSTRLAPALMALAVIPAVGAWFLPGFLLVIAALLALGEPAGGDTRIAR
ncbi:MAG: hypothetical protein E6J29_07970 [Chloroflexi bacterium]|nr:MAG: hypothetical protein E6J29_07970 [Chloroflexota bacterium]TMD55075.1 MAG: hypothetical protein E6I85_04305 [Chloroflexota bacterium]